MKHRILITLSLVAVLSLCLGVACSASTVNFDPNGAAADTRVNQLAPDIINVYGFYDDGFILNNDSTYPEEYRSYIEDQYHYGDADDILLWGVVDDNYSDEYLNHIVEYSRRYNYIDFIYQNLSPYFAYSGAPGSGLGYDPIYYRTSTYLQDAVTVLSVDVSLRWFDDAGDVAYYNFVVNGEIPSNTDLELSLSGVVEIALVNAGFTPGAISPERNLCVEYISLSFYCGTGFDDSFSYTTCDRSSAGFEPYVPPESLNVIRPTVDVDFITWLKESVQTFLNTPIFGEDITFGGILAIFIALPLVVWFLKVAAGG